MKKLTGVQIIESTTLPTPPAGYVLIAPKTDGKIYSKDPAGVEIDLTLGASFATPALTLGTAAAAGSATTTIRSDATIPIFDAVAPAALGAASAGSIAFAARRDHIHPVTGLAVLSGGNTFSGAQIFPGATQIATNGQVGVGAANAATSWLEVSTPIPSGAATTTYGAYLHAAANTNSTTEFDGLRVLVTTQATVHTIVTAVALRVAATSLGAGSIITNNYGIWIEPRTVGTNDYGIRIDSAQTQTLWLSGDVLPTTAAQGIAFGSALDTTLYRFTTNVLRVANILDAVTGYRIGGAAASGQFLRGNGTNFVSSAIVAGDLPDSISGFAVPALTLGTTNVEGVSTNAIRTDATIALFDATVPSALGTASAGSIAFAARRDHIHPTTNLAVLNAVNTFTAAMVISTTGSALVVGSGTSTGSLAFNGGAGFVRDLAWQTNSVYRWLLRCNATAETGSNAGSDFEIIARDDAGAQLFQVFTAIRSTGLASFPVANSQAAGVRIGTDAYIYRSAAGVLGVTSIVDAATGYRVAGAATSGNYLRGNGTNFVSSTIQAADLPDSISGFAVPALILGTTNVEGVSTNAIRTDATIIAFDATVPAALGTAAAGSIAFAARRDHIHPTTGLALLAGGNTFSGIQTFPQAVFDTAGRLTLGSTTTTSNYQFEVTGSALLTQASSYGAYIHPTAQSGVLTEYNALRVQVVTVAATYTIPIAVALRIASTSLGAGTTITNNYGIWIEPRTVGTNDYGVRIDTAQTQTLWIAGDDATATTAAKGIAFGSARDVTIYRSAASYLTIGAGLVVSSGNFQVDVAGRVGLLGASPTYALMDIGVAAAHPNGTATSYGLMVDPTFPATNTSVINTYIQMRTAVSTTLTSAYGLQIVSPVFGASSAITNNAGISISNQGVATVVNAFGLDIASQLNATTLNVAARLGGGTQANLWLNSDTASVAGGIAFGTARDTTLYRSAAAALTTNSTITSTGLVVSGGGVALTASAGNGTYIDAPSGQSIFLRPNASGLMLTVASTGITVAGVADSTGNNGSKNLSQMQMGANFTGAAGGVLYGGFPALTNNGTLTNSGYTDMIGTLFTGAGTLGAVAGISGTTAITTAGSHPEFTTIFKTDAAAITSCRYWIGLTNTTLTALAVAPTTQHIAAFRYDTGLDGSANWRAVTCNGTSATVVDTGIAIAANTRYSMRVVYNVTKTAFDFYINEVLVASISTTLPATTTFLFPEVSNTAITAVVRNIAISHMTLRHN